ncbi:hypothetical protein GEMRC1_000259 [Eukaryota sp. GEM-RC1]
MHHKQLLEEFLHKRPSPTEVHFQLFKNSGFAHCKDPSEIFENMEMIGVLQRCIEDEENRRKLLECKNFYRSVMLPREVFCLQEQCEAIETAKANMEKQMIAELEMQSYLTEIHHSKKQELSLVERRRGDLEAQQKVLELDLEELRKEQSQTQVILSKTPKYTDIAQLKELEEEANRLRDELHL